MEELSKENGGILPDMAALVKEIWELIEWQGIDNNIPTPKSGYSKVYEKLKCELI